MHDYIYIYKLCVKSLLVKYLIKHCVRWYEKEIACFQDVARGLCKPVHSTRGVSPNARVLQGARATHAPERGGRPNRAARRRSKAMLDLPEGAINLETLF